MAITMAFTKEKNEECLFNVWRMFSLDLRSLALFRILISFISLIDLSEVITCVGGIRGRASCY